MKKITVEAKDGKFETTSPNIGKAAKVVMGRLGGIYHPVGFAKGSASFSVIEVDGPKIKPQEVLERLKACADAYESKESRDNELKVNQKLVTINAGETIDDYEFGDLKNVFDDAVHFGIRIDSNTVPSAIKNRIRMNWKRSGKSKAEIKYGIIEDIGKELRSLKHVKTTLKHGIWYASAGKIFISCSTKAFGIVQMVCKAFPDHKFHKMTSGYIAQGRKILHGDEDGKMMPWAQGFDWYGDEFLLWILGTDNLPLVGEKDCFVPGTPFLLQNSDSADVFNGSIGREFKVALSRGMLPRRSHVIGRFGDDAAEFEFDPESLSLSGIKITFKDRFRGRDAAQVRVDFFAVIVGSIVHLFNRFLDVRLSDEWETIAGEIAEWVKEGME